MLVELVALVLMVAGMLIVLARHVAQTPTVAQILHELEHPDSGRR